MKYFKIVPFMHTDKQGIKQSYAIKRRRRFLFIPYWSFRTFQSSKDHCYTETYKDAEEIIDNLKRI